MSRRGGIVNVRMVITEEKILSNIDKVQKMINPNSKKKLVQLEEDSYFKDLIESIKTYLIEYPKKKNFPINIYKATYGLVEFATSQFEKNTKKIEDLIKQRENNVELGKKLDEVVKKVEEKQDGWQEAIEEIEEDFDEDIIHTLNTLGKCKTNKSQKYIDSSKLLKARVHNLESNLHIEIDIERLEDSSKALSYIGVEIADALKLIPTPEEFLEKIAEENAVKETKANTQEITQEKGIEELVGEKSLQEEQEQYIEETTFEAKPSLWKRFINSKIVRAATYIFRIKIRIELPSALPEGKRE